MDNTNVVVSFSAFKAAVAAQWDRMRNSPLFRTDVEKELLWLTYLESFPAGTNPKMRERTEYDCSACRGFIKAVGSVVAVIDGQFVSLWDVDVPYPYNVVAAALSELVKGAPIKNVLLHDQAAVGVDKNFQEVDGEVLTWTHFHIVLPQGCVSRDRGAAYGTAQSTRDVFQRALEEITIDALDTTIDLIAQGSLYRGEEHLATVQSFLKQKKAYVAAKSDRERELLTWQQGLSSAITHVRNSAIGTLLDDLAKGTPLDDAVRMFESKVAPANYKRPKAPVTKAMIERARKTVEELGYASALDRRFARVEDVTINNVLFANRDARKAMNADVFDALVSTTRPSTKSLEKVEEVGIEAFIETILPKATALELLFENRHAGNLVNLVAPASPDAKLLFKWPNNFSWAYNGDLADSIKERVKTRGGSVTGDFRASLGWFNSDDLDLHLVEPNNREEIYFGHRRSCSGGELDVDMNVSASGPNTSRNAVENITYAKRSTMREGKYKLYVHNYRHREHIDVGFEVELEFDGTLHTFTCEREVRPQESVTVALFTYSRKDGLKIIESLPSRAASRTLWNLPTETFHPVTMVMLSPNHWDGRPVGNKHYFFMLQDCKREGSSRGFFNEQLSDDLREHRKVFELIGAKMRTEEEGEQLSGLGFSSTQRNSVLCKVSGSFNRTVKIVF